MEESFDIPDLDSVQDLATAKFLLEIVSRAAAQQSETIAQLTATIELLREELAEFKRALLGPKTERVVPVDREIRKKARENETPEEREARLERTRQQRAAAKEKRRESLESQTVEHPVDDMCQQCGLSLEGAGVLEPEVSEEYEYVPPRVIRRIHRRQRKVCTCGCFAIGDAPVRVVDGCIYGPGLHAHVVIAKCLDSIPLERQSRTFARVDVPMSPSSLCDQFHRGAALMQPIAQRILELIAGSSHVNADETSIKVQDKGECRRCYVWDFIATDDDGHMMVAYRFSADRSGATPVEVLGQTTGVLQVDGYTGYNHVTTPDTRSRAGCWSHARRKFFHAIATSPDEAHTAIDFIREFYEVEYDAVGRKILGTERHLALRRTITRDAVDRFYEWVAGVQTRARPKSKLGEALTYVTNQRAALELFLDDAKVALDNNVSERQLRLIALGRKNFLFVGNESAGANLAINQTIVSTCVANGLNPFDYYADVLIRIQTHPASALDELLPWNWKRLRETD